MRQFILAICFLMLSNQAHAQSADKTFFGFNWGSYDDTSCTVITKQMQKKFSQCKPARGFGQQTPLKACTIGKVEWFVYKTRKACEKEMEIMQANAATS